MLQACLVYEAHFPESINYAHNLFNLSYLYESTGRKEESVLKLQGALQLYEKNGDQTMAERCETDLQRQAK